MSTSDKIASRNRISRREDQILSSPLRYGVALRSKSSDANASENNTLHKGDLNNISDTNAKKDASSNIISTNKLLEYLGHRHGAATVIKQIARENPALDIGPKPNTKGRERLYEISIFNEVLKRLEECTPPEGWIPKKQIPKRASMWYRAAMSMLEEISKDNPEMAPKAYKAPNSGKVGSYYPPCILEEIDKRKKVKIIQLRNYRAAMAANLNKKKSAEKSETKTTPLISKIQEDIIVKNNANTPGIVKITSQFEERPNGDMGVKKIAYLPIITNKNAQKIKEKPDKWVGFKDVAHSLGITERKAQKVIQSVLQSGAQYEYGKFFNVSIGRKQTYYEPKVMHEASKIILAERPKSGWVAISAASKRMHMSNANVATAIANLNMPEDKKTKVYMKIGRPKVYYSTDAIEAVIRSKSAKIHNWLSKEEACSAIGVNSKSLNAAIKKALTKNAAELDLNDHVAIFSNKKYYSNSLISMVRQTREDMQRKPNGWMSFKELARKAKINYNGTCRALALAKRQNPNMILSGKYYNSINRLSMYYSPESVSLIKGIQAQNKPPDGWVSKNAIAKKLGLSPRSNLFKQALNEALASSNAQSKTFVFKNKLYVYFDGRILDFIGESANKIRPYLNKDKNYLSMSRIMQSSAAWVLNKEEHARIKSLVRKYAETMGTKRYYSNGVMHNYYNASVLEPISNELLSEALMRNPLDKGALKKWLRIYLSMTMTNVELNKGALAQPLSNHGRLSTYLMPSNKLRAKMSYLMDNVKTLSKSDPYTAEQIIIALGSITKRKKKFAVMSKLLACCYLSANQIKNVHFSREASIALVSLLPNQVSIWGPYENLLANMMKGLLSSDEDKYICERIEEYEDALLSKSRVEISNILRT